MALDLKLRRPPRRFIHSLVLPPGGGGGSLGRDPRLEDRPIQGGAADLDKLVCDGMPLRGSIEATAVGG